MSPSLIHSFLRRRSIATLTIALLIASATVGYRADDWSRFDHQPVRVVAAITGDSLQIETANGKTDTAKLLGAAGVEPGRRWLQANIVGKQVTLLLQSPQTRDPAGRLRAFALLDNQNLSVELTKAGLAYADRREKTEMDGVIDPAESDARKKQRGIWATIKFEQMPAWRQAWLKSLPPRR
jgi:endonuclease YncB( thermonuclease family)